MTIAAPILEAEDVLTTAIRDALAPFVDALLERFKGRPRVYYREAEQGCPLPFVIFQFQSDINRRDWIGESGGTALLTLKVFVSTTMFSPVGTAPEFLSAVAPAMNAITMSGYTIKARYLRTPNLPQTSGTIQAGLTYRLSIERS